MDITGEYDPFVAKNGESYHLVRFIQPNWLLVWKGNNDFSASSSSCEGLRVQEVESDVLKELKVWGDLSEKIQKEVEDHTNETRQEKIDRMAHARKSRTKKYANVPENLTCCKCDNVDNVYPCLTAKKIEKLDITVEKYLETYVCKICNPPVRGRKANPKNAPTDLVCKCGKKVTYPLNMLVKRAKDKNTTVEELINGYLCTSCNPVKRGRKKGTKMPKKVKEPGQEQEAKKRGRKATKDFSMYPENLTCKCKATVKANYYYLEKKAADKNVTIMDLVNGYRCQKCESSKGRKKGQKMKKKKQ